MSLVDIRCKIGFPTHRKTRQLIDIAGEPAFRALLTLWCHARTEAPTGELLDYDGRDIEFHAQWTGEKGAFFKAIRKVKFLDKIRGGWYLHDWKEHQPYAANAPARSAAAAKAASAKWKKAKGKKPAAPRIATASESQAKRIAPSPAPVPDPDPAPSPDLRERASSRGRASRKRKADGHGSKAGNREEQRAEPTNGNGAGGEDGRQAVKAMLARLHQTTKMENVVGPGERKRQLREGDARRSRRQT